MVQPLHYYTLEEETSIVPSMEMDFVCHIICFFTFTISFLVNSSTSDTELPKDQTKTLSEPVDYHVLAVDHFDPHQHSDPNTGGNVHLFPPGPQQQPGGLFLPGMLGPPAGIGHPGIGNAVFRPTVPVHFNCYNRYPGYYADYQHECRSFFVCTPDGRIYHYECSYDYIFNQFNMRCEPRYYSYDCRNAQSHYFVNAERRPFFVDDPQ